MTRQPSPGLVLYALCVPLWICPQVFVTSKNSNEKSDNCGSIATINILVGGLRSEAKEQTSDGGTNITASWMQDSVQMWPKDVSGIAMHVGLLCGEIGWWPHRDAFHLLISVVQVHLWNQVTSLNSVVTTGVQTGFVNLCSVEMPDGSLMSIVIV